MPLLCQVGPPLGDCGLGCSGFFCQQQQHALELEQSSCAHQPVSAALHCGKHWKDSLCFGQASCQCLFWPTICGRSPYIPDNLSLQQLYHIESIRHKRPHLQRHMTCECAPAVWSEGLVSFSSAHSWTRQQDSHSLGQICECTASLHAWQSSGCVLSSRQPGHGSRCVQYGQPAPLRRESATHGRELSRCREASSTELQQSLADAS